MTIHAVALSVHILTAILGLGQIAAMASLASSSAESTGSAPPWRALQRLATTSSWSLLVMLLSGVALDYSVGGGYHGFWWFRLSFLGLLVIGALLGWTRRTIRKNVSSGDRQALRGVSRATWVICGLIAIISIVMQTKPWS
jgi:hypothetical protein